MADLRILPRGAAGRPNTNSFEDERREVLESVMRALSSGSPDADEMAACAQLLHHLAGATTTTAA